MTWILPAVLTLTACSLALSAILWVTVKRQTWENGREARRFETNFNGPLASLTSDFEALRVRFDALEQRTGVLVTPAPAISGLNLTRRTQALRMLSRGEQPDRIAAALHLPRAEAALLVKVKRLYG